MSVTGSIMAGAGLASAGIGAIGANSAAGKQVDAANNAAALQHQDAQDALNFEKQQYGNSLQMLNPYLQTGYGALGLLRTGLGIGGPTPQGFSLGNTTPSTPSFVTPQDPNIRALMPGGAAGGGRSPLEFNAESSVVPRVAGANGNQFNSVSPINGGTFQLPGASPITANGGGSVQPVHGGTFQASTNQGGGAVQSAIPTGGGNVGFGSLLASYPGGPFSAPTGVTEQNDPGYQFRLKTGIDALNNSAAARGGLLNGGTAKSLEDFAQNDASNEYGNVYNRALNTYGTNYNQFVNDQTNQFNKLAAISGLGQTTAQDLSNAGLTAGNNVSSTLLNSGAQIGQDLNNAGAARASGITGVTNSITGGLGSLALLSQLLKSSGGTNMNIDPGQIGFCWIAEELYGVDNPKTHAIRGWLHNVYRFDPIGKHFVALYEKYGEQVAEHIKHDASMRAIFKPLFDEFAERAMPPQAIEDFESVRYQR